MRATKIAPAHRMGTITDGDGDGDGDDSLTSGMDVDIGVSGVVLFWSPTG